MPDFVLTEVYDLLLRGSSQVPVGVCQLYLVTAEQLCRLHYSPGSIKAVKARLKLLVDNGYLLADNIPSKKPHSPYYYTLAAKGMRYLKKEGYDIAPSMRASKEQDKQYTHIKHTLELNDVIIAASLLEKHNPTYRLASFIHERELKRPQYRYDVVPDALLDFRKSLDNGKQRRMTVLLEHDRASEHINAFKPRIRAYVKMLKTESYKNLYGVGTVTVAVTTSKGEYHAEKLRRWTREELKATGNLQTFGPIFYFTNLAPTIDPKVLWLEPVWCTPDVTEPLALLAG